MIVAPLLAVAFALQAPTASPQPPTPPPSEAKAEAPPVLSLDVLQARSEAELLRLDVERLTRRVAELEGLVEFLSRPTLQRLSEERRQLEEEITRAGYVRDEQGRLQPRESSTTEEKEPRDD